MSQNDLSIANQGFASFRSDLNSALQALGSTNSGTSAPSTTYANQLFYDTTNNILKIRNEDNDAFISLFTLDQTNDNIESLRIDGVLSYVGDLQSLTSGTSNFRAGVNAGDSITSGGNFNTVVGDEAGQAITTGDSNVAVGFEALSTEDTHSRNTAIGHQSLKTLNAGANAQSTAVGYNSAKAVTTGIENVFIGASSGESATTPNYTVAVGKSALGAVLTGDYNTALGYHAGLATTSGTLNTLVGAFSGDAITEGTTNCALGYLTLSAETTGQRNTAMGYSALANQNNTGGTQANNTAFGFFAGLNITTGVQNTFVGANAGDALTDADGNVALGYGALGAEEQGNKSTAVGWQALLQANRGSSGDSFNTAVGFNAGSGVNTGVNNTFIGGGSGSTITSGSQNTILGRYNGNQDSLDIRTADHNLVLSTGDGSIRASRRGDAIGGDWGFRATSSGAFGFILDNFAGGNPNGLLVRTPNSDDDDGSEQFINCTGSSTTRFLVNNQGDVKNHDNTYGAISDEKLKEQITDATSQWEDIKALTVRKFKFKEDVAKGDSDAHWRLGVIAQEVEKAGMNGLVDEDKDRELDAFGKATDLGTTTKTVKYSILYMKAVKALQEAMTRIETLETKVKALEG